MICCYLVTSSSHPIQMRFDKSMQTAVKRTLGKGNPSAQKPPNPRIKCLWFSTFVGMLGTGKSALALDPRKKGIPSTLEKRKLFFSQMSPVFGGSLTLSFLLLTCTSSSIKQALWKNYEWISKKMLLNEKFIQPVLLFLSIVL